METAVYAASEGLSVVVMDARAFGGQAGASARIENYLGFPTGISGHALAGRAFSQAQKFGAEIMIPVSARSLDCERRDGAFALALESGDELRSRAIVVLTSSSQVCSASADSRKRSNSRVSALSCARSAVTWADR